jgi:DNA-binding response OmpR family regulator
MTHKILVADDEPNILLSLEFLLHREGFEVSVARNGQQTLDAIRTSPPDLLVLDVMMPVKSGLEVCQQLRADPATSRLPILMLTAKGRETDMAKGLALGADAYMTKPFSTRELVAKVRSLLAT